MMNMETIDTMDEVFHNMMHELGYEEWWECDDKWEEMEESMVAMGFNAEEVRAYFAEMEEEL